MARATKDLEKAATTLRAAVMAGDIKKARNAFRYVRGYLDLPEAPTSDAPDIWANVSLVVSVRVQELVVKARRKCALFA